MHGLQLHSTIQDSTLSGTSRGGQSFTVTEVDASEYEPQIVELPPSPPPDTGEQEGRGKEEEDDGGKEETESQRDEGVKVPVCEECRGMQTAEV